ncbi:MAG: SpoIID/LytB domain-containing protein [Firmicutes bacterium]|nr:SpoIID/LytB domain-containing protein [Bacillota bacterium]
MKRKKQILIPVMLLVLFLAMTAGCSWFRRTPEKAPLPENNKGDKKPIPQVTIPDPINRGARREPVLKVYVADKGQIETMKFEDYIQGVVAAEMDPEWPQEAFAAQAIIARSFTLQKIAEDGGVPARKAHASTDIKEFQAYDASRVNDNVRKAVNSSRGQVAVYGDEFIRGWFHAYAGPRTALATEGLEYEGPNPPYIRIVDSPAEGTVPEEEKNWRVSYPLSRIRAVTREITGKDPGKVEKVEIAAKGPSGRATRLRVNNVEVSCPELRLALDSTQMRSTYLTALKIENGQLVMEGSGYGHGVGMCQWGARSLAEEGKSAEEIVRYYYRNIEIIRLWE